MNEDSVRVFTDNGGFCALLADGLGGQGNGDLASQTAIRAVLDSFLSRRSAQPSDIFEYIQNANGVIREINQGKNTTMTTIVGLFADSERISVAHVGDSRLYHFEEGQLEMQTIDHSVPQMAVALGEITADQIRFHPDRNRILRAIGADDSVKPDVQQLNLRPGFHAFLLCSDGLWEYVTEQEMEADLAKSETADDWLRFLRCRRDMIAPENADNNSAVTVFLNVYDGNTGDDRSFYPTQINDTITMNR